MAAVPVLILVVMSVRSAGPAVIPSALLVKTPLLVDLADQDVRICRRRGGAKGRSPSRPNQPPAEMAGRTDEIRARRF
jgi:hypothetical protein